MERMAGRGVWMEEAGGEREARLRFLAERGLRLLMADIDPSGREALHFFDPREVKTLHLISSVGGGLLEKAVAFFPSAARWMRLLYGQGGDKGKVGDRAEGRSAAAWVAGGNSRKGSAMGWKAVTERPLSLSWGLDPERGLLWEMRGGRVFRVVECLREGIPLWMRGCRVGGELEWARRALCGDPFLFLSLVLAIEDVRGYQVSPSARKARTILMEILRMRSHGAWLSGAAELSGRFRLQRRLRLWRDGVSELERVATHGREVTEMLVPGGMEMGDDPFPAGELLKGVERLSREWEVLGRKLASISPPRWASRLAARLPRKGKARERRRGTVSGGDGEGWEAWVGPLARALGQDDDARVEDPALSSFPGWSPGGKVGEGDILKRMTGIRLMEISNSLGILDALLRGSWDGPLMVPPAGRGSGRGFGRCEAPEGETCCHLVLGRGRVAHVAFSSPRELNRSAASCLEGAWVDEAFELMPLLLPP
ncbi:MAG: hypothetical protein ACUVT4_06135 [Actinomycetota bacterium]